MNKEQQFLSVGDAYDRWSSIYDGYDNPMVFMAAEIVSRSLSELDGQAVFEFGCGTGRNLATMDSFGARIISGCDLSEGMLSVARARIPDARLIRQDMNEPVDVPEGAFDLALFCLSLEHVEDLRLPLREARRIARVGGCIRVIEIHPFLSLNGLAAHFDMDGVEFRMPTYPHQFEDYLPAFRDVGLRVAQCREWTPNDVGNPAELRSHKRGPEVPLAVEFELRQGSS